MVWRSASQAGKEEWQWKEGWRCSIFSDRSSPHHLLCLLRFLKFLSPRLWLLQLNFSSLLFFNTSCSSGCGLNLGFLPSQLFFRLLESHIFSPSFKRQSSHQTWKTCKTKIFTEKKKTTFTLGLIPPPSFLLFSPSVSDSLLFLSSLIVWKFLGSVSWIEWGNISLAFSLILLHLQSHLTSDLLHWKYSFSVPVNLFLSFFSFVLIKIIIILIRRFISQILASLWESCFLCRSKIGLLLK